MANRRFDALFLDFYGTVSAGDRIAVEATCRTVVETMELATTPTELAIAWGEQFFAILDHCNQNTFRTLLECERISLQQTLSRYETNVDPTPFVAQLQAYCAAPPIYDDAMELLRQVDLPTVCVSNADNAPLGQALARNRLHFDAVVTSEDARCYKPDRRIFEQALRAVRVEPDRVIHVGDSLYSDVGGAAGVGIATCWLCRTDRIHDIGTCRPDFTIATLAELPAILDS